MDSGIPPSGTDAPERHPSVGPGGVKSREEKTRDSHDLGALPGEGSHSPLKQAKEDLLTSLRCHPLIPAKPPPPPPTQQACQAMPNLLLGPSPTRSFQVCASSLCWRGHQQSLGPGRPWEPWSQLEYGNISLPFSSAETRWEFSEMNFTRKPKGNENKH